MLWCATWKIEEVKEMTKSAEVLAQARVRQSLSARKHG